MGWSKKLMTVLRDPMIICSEWYGNNSFWVAAFELNDLCGPFKIQWSKKIKW